MFQEWVESGSIYTLSPTLHLPFFFTLMAPSLGVQSSGSKGGKKDGEKAAREEQGKKEEGMTCDGFIERRQTYSQAMCCDLVAPTTSGDDWLSWVIDRCFLAHFFFSAPPSLPAFSFFILRSSSPHPQSISPLILPTHTQI